MGSLLHDLSGGISFGGTGNLAGVQALMRAVGQSQGNVSQAASLLGITRPTFYALVKKYKLDIAQAGPRSD